MNSESEITVLIIDEHPEVCRLLARGLEALPGFRVLDHTTNPMLAAELAHQYSPQIIVTDFKRSGSARGSALRWLRHVSPGSSLVVYTSYYGNGEQEALQSAGVARCLLKGMSIKELGAELRKVVQTRRGDTAGGSRATAPPRTL
jgi:DNA-binding NarL/FixJ family response regulator